MPDEISEAEASQLALEAEHASRALQKAVELAEKSIMSTPIESESCAYLTLSIRKKGSSVSQVIPLQKLFDRIAQERGFEVYYVSSWDNSGDLIKAPQEDA